MRVLVTPQSSVDGEPFEGELQDDFDFDYHYVRMDSGELTGPWTEKEVIRV